MWVCILCLWKGEREDDWRSFGDRLFALEWISVIAACWAPSRPGLVFSRCQNLMHFICERLEQQPAAETESPFLFLASYNNTEENMCAGHGGNGWAKPKGNLIPRLYHTPTDWIELDLKTFSHTDMPVTFVYRQEWWNTSASRKKQVKRI